MSLPMRDRVHCPASATTACGGNGKAGDRICRAILIPSAAAVGKVQLKDGAAAAFDIFNGGTLVELRPIAVDFGPDGAISTSGGWSCITQGNVTVIILGSFTG